MLLWLGLVLLAVIAFVVCERRGPNLAPGGRRLTASLRRENDPIYHGVRLSDYLSRVRGVGVGWGKGEQIVPGIVLDSAEWGPAEASDAIVQVGANALPMLVRLLSERESPAEVWLREQAGKHPQLEKLNPMGPDTSFQQNMSALLAFCRLGPKAQAAIPQIIPLLEQPDSAFVATAALIYIQPQRVEDILSLTNVLHVQGTARYGLKLELLHSAAILALSTFGAKAARAIPLMMDQVNSSDAYVAAAAAVALARMGGPPEKVVPVILEHVARSQPTLRGKKPTWTPSTPADDWPLIRNIFALGEYGRHARDALPLIVALQTHPDESLKHVAEVAEAKITRDIHRADLSSAGQRPAKSDGSADVKPAPSETQ